MLIFPSQSLIGIHKIEKLLDRIAEEFFRRERMEEAKRLDHLKQPCKKTPKSRSS